MVVVNIVGFAYKLNLRNGKTIVIPFDHQPHEVPDEIANNKFDNVFKVIIPPQPKVPFVSPAIEKAREIMEIRLEEPPKVEDKPKVEVETVTEVKEEISKPPLKGIKIKKGTRAKLIKKGKPRNEPVKVEEITNGNN